MKKQRETIELIKVELTEGMARYPDVLYEYRANAIKRALEEGYKEMRIVYLGGLVKTKLPLYES